MKFSIKALTVAAAVLFSSAAAQANLVTISDSSNNVIGTLDGGALSFVGYTAPGVQDTISPYTAITTTVKPADATTLVPIANSYFGTSFTPAQEARTDGGGVSSLTFNITSTYFSLTFGQQQTAFFQNLSGGTLVLTYNGTGQANGLSHYSQYNATAVPGPIVGAGLPGLLLAFGGLLAWRRRKAAIA